MTAVLGWLLALPLWRSARHRVRVASVVPEGDDMVSVHLIATGTKVSADAGQFFTFRFLNGRGWTRGHPYSLSAAPDGARLRITAKIVGDGSGALRSLQPGTRVLIEGPYGRLSQRARTRRRVALIGAGVGITPLRALAEALPYAPGEATLLYRFTGRPLFEGELRELAAVRGLEVLMLPGHRRAPRSWLGTGVGAADDTATLPSGCRTSPIATSSSAGPPRGPKTCDVPPLRPAFPPTASTSKASAGEPQMKRIVLFLMSTVTVLVLVFGYHTSTSSRAAGGGTSIVIAGAPTTGSLLAATTATTSPVTTSAAATSAASTASTATTLTIAGDVSATRWGPVQVQLTVVGGKITTVAVVRYPSGNGRDQEINATALPILVQETISAQSAKIDMVSGATVTSGGYLSSLHSALDKR